MLTCSVCGYNILVEDWQGYLICPACDAKLCGECGSNLIDWCCEVCGDEILDSLRLALYTLKEGLQDIPIKMRSDEFKKLRVDTKRRLRKAIINYKE